MAPLSFDVSSPAGLAALNEYLATRSYITGCVPRSHGAVGCSASRVGPNAASPGQAAAAQQRATTAPVPRGGRHTLCGNQLRVRRPAGSLLFGPST